MIGKLDDWTPAAHCLLYIEKLQLPHNITLKMFRDAHHLFDYPDTDIKELRHTLRSDQKAAAKAIQMTQDYLDENT